MNKRTEENAARLSAALYNNSGDKGVIKILAHYLHYEPTQLEKDIDDLYLFIQERKHKEEN